MVRIGLHGGESQLSRIDMAFDYESSVCIGPVRQNGSIFLYLEVLKGHVFLLGPHGPRSSGWLPHIAAALTLLLV